MADYDIRLDDDYMGQVVKGCPSPEAVQSASVRDFDYEKYRGRWYWHEVHDWTQFHPKVLEMAYNYHTTEAAACAREERPLWQTMTLTLSAAGIAAAAILGCYSVAQPAQQQLFVRAIPQTGVQVASTPVHGFRTVSRAAPSVVYATDQYPEQAEFVQQYAADDVAPVQAVAPKTPISFGWLMLLVIPFNAAIVALVSAATAPKHAMAATTGRKDMSLHFQMPETPTPEGPRPFKGVPLPAKEPKFSESPVGFVRNAEVMNSRAAMMGFFALLLVEAILGGPILEPLGFTVGNGINFGF